MHEQTLTDDQPARPQPAGAGRRWPRCAPGTGTPVTVAGIEFPGLVGLAAGMDKNGVGVRAWGALGFGHAELGTVTAQAQPGNDRPRLFRLPDSRRDHQPDGLQQPRRARRWPTGWRPPGWPGATGAVGIPLGISIGKTKIIPLAEATEDYLASLRILAPYADYLAVNVSSPNTPGLRSLQDADTLGELIKALVGRGLATGRRRRRRCRSSSSSPPT